MKMLILGNGPAGVLAAETLRQAAPRAEITLVGAETFPPYSRMAIPYFLMGNIGEEGTYLRKSAGHFDALNIRQVQGRAARIDTAAKSVQLEDGKTLAYEKLLIATGSHPLPLPIPGADLPQVHFCWTLEDARGIAQNLRPGARVLQIGAGFIGCIIMEALVARAAKLTVVEMGDRMVPRMMTPAAGQMIRRWVEAKGVRVVTEVKVEKLIATEGAVEATLSTGERIVCDQVIAAAGVAPNIGFLKGSGIQTARGIQVDARLQTSAPDVYAAGDVAEAAEFGTGNALVNAIQPDAVEQARVAALNMAGLISVSPGSLAINVLDTLGLISSSFGQWQGAAGGESVEHLDADHHRYLSLQFQNNRLIGATAVGLTAHVGALRGLIQGRQPLGEWEARLIKNPQRFFEAWLAKTQPTTFV